MAAAGFLLVAALVALDATAGLDAWALGATGGWREGFPSRLAYSVTLLGYSGGVIPIAAAAGLALAHRGRWWRFPLPPLTLAAADTCNVALKDLFRRARPLLELGSNAFPAPDDYAFPSGHAMDSAALYGVLVLWVLGSTDGRRRWATALALALLPLLIGLSRVALGVHWLSDVVGGWLAGMAVAALVLWIWRRFDRS